MCCDRELRRLGYRTLFSCYSTSSEYRTAFRLLLVYAENVTFLLQLGGQKAARTNRWEPQGHWYRLMVMMKLPAILAAVTLTVVGCSGGGSDPSAAPDAPGMAGTRTVTFSTLEPPLFTPDLIEQLRQSHQWEIDPDEEATETDRDTAVVLADRFAATDNDPRRRVVAVSLAKVTGPSDTYDQVWVVFSENVLVNCLGPVPCTEYGQELSFVSPTSLKDLASVVF